MFFIIKLLNKKYAVQVAVSFFAVFLFFFFVGGGVPVVLKGYIEKTRSKVDTFINDSDRVYADSHRALSNLNSMTFSEPCGEDMLKAMRYAQFDATFIKDIGYSENGKLLCTSGLGRLKKPFEEVPPQVVTPDGGFLWLNVPIKLFDFEKKSHVLKVGSYNTVFNISELEKNINPDNKSAFYIRQLNKEPYFYSGNKDISPDYLDNTHTFSLKGMTSVYCSDLSYICSAAFSSYTDIIYYESALIFGIVLLSALSSLFISKFVYEKLKEFRDIKYRFRYGMTPERVLCYYQPIVELSTRRIVGFEVLCRWVDYDGQVVSPDKFLHIVKELKVTKEFTQMIINKTLEELHGFLALHREMKISFNIFPTDFNTDVIKSMLSEFRRLHPDCVINVELTEDELVEINSASACADVLQESGYTIAIDDFGTGYSSLSYLREIRADFIKIDKSFVKEIEKGAIKANLIPNIVAIADSLGSNVIAEGIEVKEQIDYLSSFNVLYGQGYFFSRPCPAKDFVELFCDDKLC